MNQRRVLMDELLDDWTIEQAEEIILRSPDAEIELPDPFEEVLGE
jgi:hypothetical protein